MISRISRPLVMLVVFAYLTPSAYAAFHLWETTEVYSNADGSVQFIEMSNASNNENSLGGHTITSVNDDEATSTDFTFPSNLGSTQTAGKRLLLATSGFEAAWGITPDYIIPNGFLHSGEGTLEGIANDLSWAALPQGAYSLNTPSTVAPATPQNFAGDTASPRQIVATSSNVFGVVANSTIGLDFSYNTNPPDPTLTGVGVRIHYDSAKVSFNQVTNLFGTNFIQQQDQEDTSNHDDDPTTDRFYLIAWADISGSWPGTLPQALFTISFDVASDFDSSYLNITESSAADGAGYSLQEMRIDLLVDEEPPVLAGVPADTELVSNAAILASATEIIELFETISCTDATDPTPTLEIQIPALFPVGVDTEVQILCTDSSGNQVGDTVTVTVSSDLSAANDLDGDGASDLLLRNASNGQWFAHLLQGGNAHTEQALGLTDSRAWRHVSLADFNGDGTDDILLRHENGSWYAYLMDGVTPASQGFINMTDVLDWQFLGTGDLNADGRADVLIRHRSLGTWYSYQLDGLDVIEAGAISMTTDPLWRFQAFADFDGDGNADVLVRNTGSGSWHLYTLNGRNIQQEQALAMTTDPSWQWVDALDLDGDGAANVLLRNTQTGAWQHYSVGDGEVSSADVAISADPDLVYVQSGDYNGDGNADVLLRNLVTGGWSAVLLNGAQVLDTLAIAAATDLAWEVVGGVDRLAPTLLVPDNLVIESNTAIALGDAAVQTWLLSAQCSDSQDTQPALGFDFVDTLINPGQQTSVIFTCEDAAGNLAFEERSLQVEGSAVAAKEDYTGDRQTDLMLRNLASGEWQFHGIQNGEVVSTVPVSATNSPDWQAKALADFDGDGIADILIRHTSGSWYLYLMGEFGVIAGQGVNLTRSLDWDMVDAADLNGDGSADVVLRHSSGGWYAYLLQGASIVGAGGINATTLDTWQPIAVRDLDGDGRADLLLRHTSGGWYSYQLNGTQILSAGTIGMTTDQSWTPVAVEDFNADGRADVLARRTSGHWFLYELDHRDILASGAVDLSTDRGNGFAHAGDYNGDGAADVLLRNRSSGQWHQYSLLGSQVFADGPLAATNDKQWVHPLAPAEEASTVAHDINGDGRSDILLRRNSGHWYHYQLNGTAFSGAGAINGTLALSWVPVSDADFNGDGKADLLLRNSVTNTWYLYLLDGSSIIGAGAVGATNNPDWQFMAAGDVNGDGRADIVIRHQGSGSWYTYMMDGTNFVAAGAINATRADSWAFTALGDFNGDGTADILVRNTDSGGWYRYHLNGTTIVSGGALNATTNLGWQFQGTGDFNGDGIADILLRHSTVNAWYSYLVSPTGLVGAGNVGASRTASWEFQSTGDFDGDGKSDLLVRNLASGSWYLYRLDGTAIVGGGGSVNATRDLNWQLVP